MSFAERPAVVQGNVERDLSERFVFVGHRG